VELLLPPSISLGYRPVHHQLIGSTWGQPVDDFWAIIYSRFNIPSDHLFPMTTHTGESIYPYFNCGVYVVRPEYGLMKRWQDDFLNLYQDPVIQGYYQQDDKYAVFIHQVVFTGVMLAELRQEQLFELSPSHNYPLHLHHDVPEEQRPSSIWDLVSARYESIFWEDDWQSHPLVDEKFIEWLIGKRL
ncbi:MAG: hypothetical protein GWN30_08895, partial [Gammaproteobacteria bacterium]|nr:hypothetical protein [Gammaproteobacteria bacterium]